MEFICDKCGEKGEIKKLDNSDFYMLICPCSASFEIKEFLELRGIKIENLN